MTLSLGKITKKPSEGVLFLLAFSIRIAYGIGFLYLNGLETGYDAGDYIQFAEYIRNQGWMVSDITGLRAHSGPGYPLLLYLDLLLFNSPSFYFSLIIGAFFNAVTTLVIFRLALIIFHSHSVALLAVLWAIFYVHYIRYVPFIGKESLVFFLFPFSILTAINTGHGSKRALLLFVLSYLWLIHIDERYFAYLPLLLLTILWIGQWQFKPMIIVFALIGIGMTPWLYRNYVVFDRPVLLTERTAPLTDRFFEYEGPVNKVRGIERKTPYQKDAIPGYEAIIDSLQRNLNPVGYGFKGVTQLKQALTAGHIPQSFSTPRKYWGEFTELLRPVKLQANFTGYGYRYHPAWQLSSNLIYGIQYGLMLFFAIYGIFILIKKPSPLVILLISFFFTHIAIHLFFGHAIQRYRVPIDFIVILFGSYAIVKFAASGWIREKLQEYQLSTSSNVLP